MSPLRTKQSTLCLLQDKIDCRILNWHSQKGNSMNLQGEADSYMKHTESPSPQGLVYHLSEVVVNSLEDLDYSVRRAGGPYHACSMIHALISEIRANASAQSENKPIEQDPKVGNDDL